MRGHGFSLLLQALGMYAKHAYVSFVTLCCPPVPISMIYMIELLPMALLHCDTVSWLVTRSSRTWT